MAASGSISNYTQTITCTDANGLQTGLPNAAFSGSLAITPVPGAAIACTLTNAAGTPNLVVTKSVTPSSTTAVVQGQVLTYKLTFDNSAGQASAPVNWTDVLSDVLDDAVVKTAPALATGSGLTVGAISTTRSASPARWPRGRSRR